MSLNLLVTSKLVCVALNDKEQLAKLDAEFHDAPYKAPPKEPVLYYKPQNTWTVDGATIEWARDFDNQPAPIMAVGGSLGVVFGKPTCRVSVDEALSYVKGFTVVGDYSLPEANYYRPDIKGKCLDQSAPVGPTIVATQELPNPDQLTIDISVNGELQSSFPMSRLLRNVAELISTLSHIMTFQEGEVMACGFVGDRVAVKPGDQVAITIEGVGTLNNTLEVPA
jgi:5-oxopent-3-ene-1,2,5-tricarboxylate decarboxylase/2-hydroxyhepta-2,4-diene-1,7-dioate isomerase